jgi:hypothetical protein
MKTSINFYRSGKPRIPLNTERIESEDGGLVIPNVTDIVYFDLDGVPQKREVVLRTIYYGPHHCHVDCDTVPAEIDPETDVPGEVV